MGWGKLFEDLARHSYGSLPTPDGIAFGAATGSGIGGLQEKLFGRGVAAADEFGSGYGEEPDFSWPSGTTVLGPSSYADRYRSQIQGPGLGHHGASDRVNVDALIRANRKKAEEERKKQAENREALAEKERNNYINSWVKDATAAYDGEDGLLAQIKADADESISQVQRVNAGLLAPLEESKAEAARRRDEIKEMEGRNAQNRAAQTTADEDAALAALGDGFIGSGGQGVDAAADIAKASSAAQQAGVNREADLAARDQQAWSTEMQDWAQADAAEAAKDIRKMEGRLLAQARRERAAAASKARLTAETNYSSSMQDQADRDWERELALAELQQGAAQDKWQMIMSAIPKQVDQVIGQNEDGEPITQPAAAFPPEVLAAIAQGDMGLLMQILAGQGGQQGGMAGAVDDYKTKLFGS